MPSSRREFVSTSALLGASTLAASRLLAAEASAGKIVAIASGNGLAAVTKAVEKMRAGEDALDAAVAGVNIVEEDPEDLTVGYGGLPNEDGDVELDAAVMHGPTHRGGAVASLRGVKTPSKVAKLVMERSDHVLLVGKGAQQFARAHGFRPENLLTEKARQVWLKWKETLSHQDDWLPPHLPTDPDLSALLEPYLRHTGTIHCSALDQRGNVSCVTTTSGLAFKIPGRVGDSPILGAGLYCDNEVGSAGSTGRGEANLVNCSSVMVVEAMRAGKSPEAACLEACRRIVSHNKMRRLQRADGKPNFNVSFYALNKQGEFGAASLFRGPKFAVHDGREGRLIESAYLFAE